MSVSREEFNLLESKLDNVMFWQEQLYGNSNMGRLIFEAKITRCQYNTIMDIMEEYQRKISANEDVSHVTYENDIYTRVYNQPYGDYHLCEDIAMSLWKDHRWEDVFVTLYGDAPKFEEIIRRGNNN